MCYYYLGYTTTAFLIISADDEPSPNAKCVTSDDVSSIRDYFVRVNGSLIQIHDMMTHMLRIVKEMGSASTVSWMENSTEDEKDDTTWSEKQFAPIVDTKWAELKLSPSHEATLAEMEELNKYLNFVQKIVKENVKSIVAEAIPSIEETSVSAICSATAQAFQNVKVEELVEETILMKLEGTLTQAVKISCKETLEELCRQCFDVPISEFPSALDEICRRIGERIEGNIDEYIQKLSNLPHSIAPAIADIEEPLRSLPSLLANLRDAQKGFVALAEAKLGASESVNTNVPLKNSYSPDDNDMEMKKTLSQLMKEKRYEEAFLNTLETGSASILDWLCRQVDLDSLFSLVPLPVSQQAVLLLLLRLSSDLATDTSQKLSWMVIAASVIDPGDASILPHLSAAIDKVYHSLLGQPVLRAHRVSRGVLVHILQNLQRLCVANEIARRYNEAW
ncbi:varicose-related protein-like [Phragmites australis]|uniref:varicose-related protein-like n=1 Tax=Phragmites australis TaxID=29695 RepID=UPI002D76DBB3|nr:varicose-related protein-like [Phragmites australis]